MRLLVDEIVDWPSPPDPGSCPPLFVDPRTTKLWFKQDGDGEEARNSAMAQITALVFALLDLFGALVERSVIDTTLW